MYEVRFVRGFWARPFGQLRQTNVAAAKKLNGRALDKLFNPKLVAVGTFKVSATPERGQLWILRDPPDYRRRREAGPGKRIIVQAPRNADLE